VHFALVIALGALLLLVPSSRATAQIPGQLTDEAFWKIVEESSEPDGQFISENFLSNEQGYQYVIPPVLDKVKSGGAYLGVGPEQNFTYMAAVHPNIAFIIDIRRQNMIEHLLYKAIFEMSANRAEFLSTLFCREPATKLAADLRVEELFEAFSSLPPDPELYSRNLQLVKDRLWKQHQFGLTKEDETSLEHVYSIIARQGTNLGYSVDALTNVFVRETAPGNPAEPFTPANVSRTITILPSTPAQPGNPGILLGTTLQFPNYTQLMTATDAEGKNWSYLANETNYQSVRELELNNRIVPIVGDFSGPKAIQAVAQYLKDHDTTVSVFYLSNVEQYLSPPEIFRKFYSNVATLPLNSSSTFIRSSQGSGAQPGVAQSSFSPIQDVLDAVMDGRVLRQSDIFRVFH